MAEIPVPEGAEMNQLRQEAIRRAREMQARAQIPVAYSPPPAPEPEAAPSPSPEPKPAGGRDDTPHPRVEQMPVHPRTEPRPQQGGRRTEPGSSAGALDFLTRDPERTMILLLLLILMEEKADNSLLFAMMYLLA